MKSRTSSLAGVGPANGHQDSILSKPAVRAFAGRASSGTSGNNIETFATSSRPKTLGLTTTCLASADQWHPRCHHREEQHVCLKGQARHVCNRPGDVGDVDLRLHPGRAVSLASSDRNGPRQFCGGVADVDLATGYVVGPPSRADALVRPVTPCLAAVYGAAPGRGM